MATTTPNFGWVVPTSTDLVKDGATAIETLGDSIDASFVGLKGGTTGQVLAKTSGTDLAFSWVAQDDSNAIQNAIVDAKGDLIAATAADTPARLAVGTNGHVLTADSTAATGLKWAAAASGKVLQIVNATYSTSTTITSTSFTDSGLTATITPTLSTSKILVLVNQSIYFFRNVEQAGAGYQIVRGATNVYTSDAEAFYTYVGSGSNSGQMSTVASIIYLDSPATTSATTYKTQWRVASSANSGTLITSSGSAVASITLLEIGA